MITKERTAYPEPLGAEEVPSITLDVVPRVVAIGLFAVLALLVVAHLAFSINQQHLGYEFFGSTILWVLFDMQGEVTVPTWYSASLLLVCSILFVCVATVVRKQKGQYQWHWYGLGLIFLGLSIDEASDFHGAVSYWLQNKYQTSGVLAYPWILPAAILTLIVGLVYLRFLLRLPGRLRGRLVLAGGLFITGALVLEAIEAVFDTAGGGESLTYTFMVAVEEGLEKAGVIVVIFALLSHLGTLAGDIRLRIAPQ